MGCSTPTPRTRAALFSMGVGANHFKRCVAVRRLIDTDIL
jgi:hypothetical protein